MADQAGSRRRATSGSLFRASVTDCPAEASANGRARHMQAAVRVAESQVSTATWYPAFDAAAQTAFISAYEGSNPVCSLVSPSAFREAESFNTRGRSQARWDNVQKRFRLRVMGRST